MLRKKIKLILERSINLLCACRCFLLLKMKLFWFVLKIRSQIVFLKFFLQSNNPQKITVFSRIRRSLKKLLVKSNSLKKKLVTPNVPVVKKNNTTENRFSKEALSSISEKINPLLKKAKKYSFSLVL